MVPLCYTYTLAKLNRRGYVTEGVTNMAAFIMDEKFYAHRKPAWHGLGIVSEETRTPLEVAEMIVIPDIVLKPLYVHEEKVAWRVPGSQAIVGTFAGVHEVVKGAVEAGYAVPHGGTVIDGHTLFHYGIVADNYQLVTHNDFVNIWHRATQGAPVETMGLLYDGNTMFVSTVLPKIDVKGDEIQLYLFGHNPVNGRTAVRCRTTGVRVVCHNTVQLALHGTTEYMFRTSHVGKEDVLEKIETWLTTIWSQRRQTIALMKEAYMLLANAPCTSSKLLDVTERVYPYERQPEDVESPEGMEWALSCDSVNHHRDAVIALFEGSRTITKATRGNMFGAWNAVVEYEQFGRPRISAMSKTFGPAIETIEKAYGVCVDVARN